MRRKSRKRPVIYLIGTAGHPNYGDELITAGWLRHLARTVPDAEVWLDSARPGQSTVLLDGLHPGLRCVDTLHHACLNAPSNSVEALEFGERVVGEPGLIPREATGVENLSRVDLVHILGGGYINRMWPGHLALVGAARAIAARYGARTAMTGAGLTPLIDVGHEQLSARLALFDLVDVRDEPSYRSIADNVCHATLSGDDAFLPLGNGQVFGGGRAGATMLCIQSDLLQVPLGQITDYVVRTLQTWGLDQETMTLVECIPPGDAAALALLQPHLPQLRLLPFSHLWRTGFPGTAGQSWISTRFHPHLVAAAAGSWGLALPISREYYTTKHESLIRMGSGWSMAQNFDDPLPIGSAPTAPYGGRLAALQTAKRHVADQVTQLARGALV